MNTLLKSGRYIYATGMMFLGILCLIFHDFIVGRPPGWNDGLDGNFITAYLAGPLLIISCIAVILGKYEIWATMVIGALIFVFSIVKHLGNFSADWLNGFKAMALFGGTLIVMASISQFGQDRKLVIDDSKQKLIVLTGCILLAAFFIGSGYAHFLYADFVEQFIPAYIPFRLFWTYFCGVCLIAGGIGIVIPQTRQLASLLSGIMVLGWFFLLHIPRFIANVNDASDRLGLFESFTFAGIFFVLSRIASGKLISQSTLVNT